VGRIAGATLGTLADGSAFGASIGLAERQSDEATDWPRLIDIAEARMRADRTSRPGA
jgi:hypothetical protein